MQSLPNSIVLIIMIVEIQLNIVYFNCATINKTNIQSIAQHNFYFSKLLRNNANECTPLLSHFNLNSNSVQK